VILEYIVSPSSFKKVHQETYGKSGSRRIVPGQYLATDPKGRAVMIGAVEKAKLVYILNRDAAANLTISSPLEAHKQQAIILSIVGVDVGFDNPMFAALEVDYGDSDADPTGEAFNNAEKVRLDSTDRARQRFRQLPDQTCPVVPDAHVLRARPRTQPRRQKVVRTDGCACEPARTRSILDHDSA
jgi:hypothetical protein